VLATLTLARDASTGASQLINGWPLGAATLLGLYRRREGDRRARATVANGPRVLAPRPELDRVLYLEAVTAQESDPVAVAEMERQGLVAGRLEAVRTEGVAAQPLRGGTAVLGVSAHKDGTMHEEDQPPAPPWRSRLGPALPTGAGSRTSAVGAEFRWRGP